MLQCSRRQFIKSASLATAAGLIGAKSARAALFRGGVAQPTYLGQLATSTKINQSFNTTFGASMMTRKGHYARVAITKLQLVYPNWTVTIPGSGITPSGVLVLGNESGSGNAIAVQAWIEYPVGTYTQIKFGGLTTGTIADFTNKISDQLSISIPNGALFYTWTHVQGSGGVCFPMIADVGQGLHQSNVGGNPLWQQAQGGTEAAVYGTSGVPTSPTSSITDNNSGNVGYFPAAIVGPTTTPSFFLLGDSRCTGDQEWADSSLDIGNLARSIGPSYPYINCGVGGDRAFGFYGSGARRMELTQYCSHIINELGVNDLNAAITSNAIASLATYNKINGARFSGKPYFLCTLEPTATSSDDWETSANQTITGYALSVFNYNAWVLGSSSFLPANTFPYADVNLGATDPVAGRNYWYSNGTPWYQTPEGIHNTQVGAIRLAGTGCINAAAMAAVKGQRIPYPSQDLVKYGSNSITYGAGKFNQALSGGQANVYGIAPNAPPYTIECWVKTSTATAQSCAMGDQGWGVAVDGSGNAGFTTRLPVSNPSVPAAAGVPAFWYTSTAIADGNWHHLALTLDLAGNFYFCVDGVVEFSQLGLAIARFSEFPLGPQTFGVGFNACNINPGTFTGIGAWTGSICEIAAWKAAKYTSNFTPPAEPYVGNEANLIGLWHLSGSLSGIRGPGGL